MRRIEGRCHCGNITYEYRWPAFGSHIPVRACSCTFCRKHGGVYTSHPKGELNAKIVDAGLINRYAFGTRTAEFYVCSTCGVVPFVTSLIDDNVYAVVNVNTWQGLDKSELDPAVTDFEGESVGERLERRQRKWISQVRIQL